MVQFEYNTKYFDGTTLKQLKPRRDAIKTFVLNEGIIVGMFQGSRGERPDLDFVIKILRPGQNEKPEPPIHSYWVVDLMLKIEKYEKEVREIVSYYLTFYDRAKPFNNCDERANYVLVTPKDIIEKYKHIEQKKTLSLEYVATVLELFILCEKRNSGAYMFRDLLRTLLHYIDGKADYMHVIKAAQPGYR